MLTLVDAPRVRTIMGAYAGTAPDATLMSEGVLDLTWDAIVASYPQAATEFTVETVAKLDAAQAYMIAAHHLAASPVVTSSKLGDQSFSFEAGSITGTIRAWESRAQKLLASAYPTTMAYGSGFFTAIRGKRG